MSGSSNHVLKKSPPMRIALIATYPEMTRTLEHLVKGTDIKIVNVHASFNAAVVAAMELEHSVDAILTRGGTGHFIKQSVSVPVVSIPISPFDLMVSISTVPPQYKKIAFANFNRRILGTEFIERLYDREIIQYTFISQGDLKQIAHQAKADGCDMFIGGVEGASYARELRMATQEIVSGQEAVYQALAEVIELVTVQRAERFSSTRLKAALNSLAEGICLTDEAGKITVLNPAAKRILSIPANEVCIGQALKATAMNDMIGEGGPQDHPQKDKLYHIQDRVINTNYTPVFLDQTFIGTVSTFQDVSKIQQLEAHIRRHLNETGLVAKYHFDDILTQNRDLTITKELACFYARTDSAILIVGESGTGKELFAHSIHNASKRAIGPFVTVNCAAIPEQLLESELFGYSPGAFTGARKEGKAGLFEMAHNGTIFLDEIGEMPKHLQSRLLRVLQEKEVMRVGDNKITSVNCRIISATNQDLEELVLRGTFRKDLYYRLATFSIKIPPLRERQKDIPLLSRKFLEKMSPNPEAVMQFMEPQLKKMVGYSWPGNIRELQSMCARMTLLQSIQGRANIQSYIQIAMQEDRSLGQGSILLNLSDDLTLKDVESEALQQYTAAILLRNNNNHSKTARQLGIGRTTLWRYLNSIPGDEEG